MLLAAALTLAQAKTNLDKAMSSVNGKISYDVTLGNRINEDRAAGKAKALAIDIAKRQVNWTQLQAAWKQYEKARAAYLNLK